MFQKDDPFVFHPFIFGGSAAQNGGLSLFNTHPANTSNSLKNQRLKEKTLLTQNFEYREVPKTQNVRCKMRPMICSLPRRPYTPHAARN